MAIIWDNNLAHFPFDSQRWGFRTDVRRAIGHHVPALATLLIHAGFSFDLLDTSAATREDYQTYPTIFLASTDVLPRAAQESLVTYVEKGKRLVCWPAPPIFDEDLRPCTVLADYCFPETRARFYPDDDQQIEVPGLAVTGWMGVQTFALSQGSRPIATRQGVPCGYERRVGRGSALLIGTWLAASSVPGRAGVVLEEQPAPSVPVAAVGWDDTELRSLAGKYFGQEGVDLLPEALPGGPAQTYIVYAYTNQRRGGTYTVAGGALTYWNGYHVVGLFELTTAESDPAQLQPIPYRPANVPHVRVAEALAGIHPQVMVSDLRIQSRVLDGPTSGVAAVAANNRWAVDIAVVLTTTVNGKPVRLPSLGEYTIPAGTGVLLPIGYPVGAGVTVLQATAQLTGTSATAHRVTLDLWAPAAGEVLVDLPDRAVSAQLDGKGTPTETGPAGSLRVGTPTETGPAGSLRVGISPGDHTLEFSW